MSDLDKIIDLHTSEIKEIKSTLDKLSIDLNVFINENKHLRELTQDLKRSIKKLAEQSDQTILRFKILDDDKKKKAYFWEMMGKHWWKVLAIGAPILGALYETGIYLRNLPPMAR